MEYACTTRIKASKTQKNKLNKVQHTELSKQQKQQNKQTSKQTKPRIPTTMLGPYSERKGKTTAFTSTVSKTQGKKSQTKTQSLNPPNI